MGNRGGRGAFPLCCSPSQLDTNMHLAGEENPSSSDQTSDLSILPWTCVPGALPFPPASTEAKCESPPTPLSSNLDGMEGVGFQFSCINYLQNNKNFYAVPNNLPPMSEYTKRASDSSYPLYFILVWKYILASEKVFMKKSFQPHICICWLICLLCVSCVRS